MLLGHAWELVSMNDGFGLGDFTKSDQTPI